MTVHVTAHAIDRYIERVAPVSRDRATAEILSHRRAITTAVAIGGRVVRLPGGERLITTGRRDIRIVTVLQKGWIEGGPEARMSRPACCAACGVHCSSPLTRACTRTDCSLAIEDRGEGGR